MFRYISVLILTSTLIFSCGKPSVPEEVLVATPQETAEKLTAILREQLNDNDSLEVLVAGKDSLKASFLVKEFYKKRNFKPLYSDTCRFTGFYYMMFRVIRDAELFGLNPEHYYYTSVSNHSDSVFVPETGKYNASRLYNIELLLTDAFFKMAHDLQAGRLSEDSLKPKWEPQNLKHSPLNLLESAVVQKRIAPLLASVEPDFPQYIDLKTEYRKFYREYSNKNWNKIPEPSDSANFLREVRNRMVIMGYLDTTQKGNDSVLLSKALKKFQKSYFLTEDGKIGKEMIKALSYSPEFRIRQVAINLDRWRWESAKSDKAYVWINLPGFKFTLAEADTVVMESRIICGDPKHPTPTPLTSKITYFTIYPYWNVPYSIASKEILPRIKWDTSYLRKNRFQVLDWNNQLVDPTTINWKKYNEKNLPYRFRQLEGSENSLGIVKFFFNNKEGVYLHDTNSKRLFKKEVRALSHGCVRLEEYWEFAKFLVRDDSVKIPRDTLAAWFKKNEQRIVRLKKQVPLYIKYFTAEVLNGNRLVIYPDIYGRDEKIIRRLYSETQWL
jgi:L,D-transpeptidase YcbB